MSTETIQPFQTTPRALTLAELESTPDRKTGVQNVYRFDNGYGASVIRSYSTYGAESGLWELAVIEFTGDNWELTYGTPVADDVIGWLSDDAVQEKLRQIRDLPARADR